MMAMSSALVVAAAMFAWSLVMATMIAIDGIYWKLFLVQQILRREMLLGDQIQNMLAQLTLQQLVYKVNLFVQRKHVIF
jgi:hypothetical protein